MGKKGKWGVMDMRRALKDRLAAYKIPVEMRVVGEVPRNAMGKGKSFSTLDLGMRLDYGANYECS